ncbi:hypothetical protein GCM10023160_10290 [Brachybacterium paraconglomeratum]|uniref:hypothetical protein n=1 Tax=Brachybacterium paraconglomeratum TaxID=173362 RepID=UPI0031ED6B97
MSALPAHPSDSIPGQDETHGRIRELLGQVTTAVLEQQPGLVSFVDHRPQRDRSSGDSWHGLQTLCHVSALLASSGLPEDSMDATAALLDAADAFAESRGLLRRSEQQDSGVIGRTWTSATGDLLEVIVGVRVAVRAISAPFLPGSLTPRATTSPATALSPLTPPPRLVR